MICPRYNACINTGVFISFVYGTMHAMETNGYTSGTMLLLMCKILLQKYHYITVQQLFSPL